MTGRLAARPLIENKITTSKNGRWLIQRTIITNILPTDYYRAILARSIVVDEEDLSDDEINKIVKEARE